MSEVSLQDLLKKLPPEMESEVRDFIEFLIARKTVRKRLPMQFKWEGTLKDLGTRYTSVDLQHQITDWRGGYDEGAT